MLVAAAILVILVAGAHSYLGERYLLMRLFRRVDLPKLFGGTDFTKHTLRFAWHLTSVAWLGLAALLLTASGGGDGSLSRQGLVVGITFAVSGVVALLGSRGRHLSWVFFFTIALLTWLGSQ